MATIALRAYIREIESLIDHNQTETAIAQCMHILQFMPKHIGTYRMLGKALHEAQRYADANDVFQRVLSTVPDDFVSNVGLSIIRQDEGNLDAAIWHMERAFEAQPSNQPIQEELRRLYGKRDGLELPRVRLTRGALARMYMKGHLYNQAIGELRAALAEDPNRADLQVLLAQACFLTGQKVESVEVCSQLIKRFPYCFEANRLLALILPGTERAKDSEIYRQRVISLDPYLQKADPSTLISDLVPDSSVVIEKLDITPGQGISESHQPGWAASLGSPFETAEATELPEWLREDQPHGSEAGLEQIPALTQKTSDNITWETSTGKLGTDWLKQYERAIEEDQEPSEPVEEPSIPDWMKAAGWESSEGGQTEAPISWEEFESAGEGEIEAGEIPDWLKAIAPNEPEADSPAAPTWLQENPPGASDTVINWLNQNQREVPEENLADLESALGQVIEEKAQEQTGVTEEVPDWLRGLDDKGPSEGPTTGELHIPEWLEEKEPGQPSGEEPATANLEWLKEIEAEPSTGDDEQIAESSLDSASEVEIPDWLKSLEPEAQVGSVETAEWLTENADETLIVPRTELTGGETVLIESTKAEAPLTVESPVSEIEETIPDWIKGEEIAAQVDQTQIEEAPAFIEQEVTVELSEEALAEETLVARTKVTEKLSDTETPEELPEWLKEMVEETQVETLGEAAIEETITAEPASLQETIKYQPQPAETPFPIDATAADSGLMNEDDALALLAALADKHAGEEGWLDTVVAETMGEDASVYAAEEAKLPEQSSIPEIVEPQAAPVASQEYTLGDGEVEAIAWLETIAESENAAQEPLVEPAQDTSIQPPAWVTEGEITDEETVIAVPGSEEIPVWLRDTEEEAIADIPSVVAGEVTEVLPPVPVKIDLNTASLSELEDLPGIGFILAQSILYYRQIHGPFEQVEDLANVPGMTLSDADALRDFVDIRLAKPEPRIVTRQFGEPRNVVESALHDARQAVNANDLSAAAMHYDSLIQQDQYLPEVIQDLQELLSHNPQDINLWQCLGDACMRNDQLPEALEAYNRAEELLR